MEIQKFSEVREAAGKQGRANAVTKSMCIWVLLTLKQLVELIGISYWNTFFVCECQFVEADTLQEHTF